MTAVFPIQKGLDKPKIARNFQSARTSRYPFHQMEVGDSFLVPNRAKNTLTTYASEQGKRLGAKFSTRLIWMVPNGEAWVPANEGDAGAVKGIFVQRDA